MKTLMKLDKVSKYLILFFAVGLLVAQQQPAKPPVPSLANPSGSAVTVPPETVVLTIGARS
jgi:hypothetical protein